MEFHLHGKAIEKDLAMLSGQMLAFSLSHGTDFTTPPLLLLLLLSACVSSRSGDWDGTIYFPLLYLGKMDVSAV